MSSWFGNLQGTWFFYHLRDVNEGQPETRYELDSYYLPSREIKEFYPEHAIHTSGFAVFPRFFYKRPGQDKRAVLECPPLIQYEREGLTASIRVLEALDTPAQLTLGGDLIGIIPPKTGLTKVNLPATLPGKILKGEALRLTDGPDWVLEHRLFHARNSDLTRDIASVRYTGYPSLKSVLDPEDGFSRLLDDILSGRFHASGKLQKLLNILRSATQDEEHDIMSSVYVNDPSLYALVTDKIFSPDLLPYLSRREVTGILQKIDDREIELALQSRAELHKYRSFLSRNRFEFIQSHFQSPEAEAPGLWQKILTTLLERRTSLLSIPDVEVPAKEFDYHETEKNFQSQYLHTGADGFFVQWEKSVLETRFESSFRELIVFYEIRRNEFMSRRFRNVAGIVLFLPTLPKIPRYVVAAGLKSNGTFAEYFAALADVKKD